MDKFLFSVCIPVYNTEKYLPRALDSIVHQNFDISNIEVVIVNDASPNTDECTRVIKEYSKHLFIQYVIHEKNGGTFLARKTAIEKSSGAYIFFLDPDDTFEIHAFETISTHIIGDPDYIQFQTYSVQGKIKSLLYLSLEDEKSKTIEDVLQNKAVHSISNKCYNGKFLKKVCALWYDFYSIYAEDYYQSVIIEFYANTKKFVDIPLYNYFRYIGITSGDVLKNKKKVQNIITSFVNVQENLIMFFEDVQQPQYIHYLNSYAKEFYNDLLYSTRSIRIFMSIINALPSEYHKMKFKLIVIYLLHNVLYIAKKCIKCIIPYGIVQLFRWLKNYFSITNLK